MIITKANQDDLLLILELQYLVYQSEAKLFGNPNIPPLKQTLQDVRAEYHKGIVLKQFQMSCTLSIWKNALKTLLLQYCDLPLYL